MNSHPKEKDVNSSTLSDTFELIYSINKKIRDWHRKVIQEYNLTIPQYCVLRQLGTSRGLNFKELAEKCNISPPTMTGVIDTMEAKEKELVMRKENPEDRRSILVVLTEKGKQLHESLPKENFIFKNCCADLAQNEIRQMNSLLRKLLENFY
ncbi:MAG: Organic hydroperoxide resistance transcriptional regulator [Promethearchaeota archaeon]|nr:MAG: Organic hydroperoxide resistance transcriptional regulator [Candidatus Lokiarchaeota archaeon]